MVTTPAVRVGQVWADNDKREAGRTVRIDAINCDSDGEPHSVEVTVLTMSAEKQAQFDANTFSVTDTRGLKRTILARRLYPTSTGYRLLSEPEPVQEPEFVVEPLGYWYMIKHDGNGQPVARWDGNPARWADRARADDDAKRIAAGEQPLHCLDVLAHTPAATASAGE